VVDASGTEVDVEELSGIEVDVESSNVTEVLDVSSKVTAVDDDEEEEEELEGASVEVVREASGASGVAAHATPTTSMITAPTVSITSRRIRLTSWERTNC
jgi:hypothetical protein